jgi:hypothetical protein
MKFDKALWGGIKAAPLCYFQQVHVQLVLYFRVHNDESCIFSMPFTPCLKI